MAQAAAVNPSGQTLYSRPFIALCTAIFLGFCCFGMVNPIIPIVVLEAGGDAFLVGIVVGVYSIPSILLRPLMGRLVDEWSRWRVLVIGATGLGLSTFVYLVPGLAAIFVTRLLNGSSFAAFNTGGNASMAALTPAARRGEGAAIYNLMPSLAFMVAPAVGLILLANYGAGAAFTAAAGLGLGAALVIGLGPLRGMIETRAPARATTWRNLIERRAVLPMIVEFLWVSTNVLFFVFPPVWAVARDIPIAELTLYYPVVGIVLVASRVIIGRRLDRWSRGAAILTGAAFGSVAIALASLADTVLLLTIAGSLFGASSSLVSPSAAAIALDRAEPERRGITMATYSMGFPLGNGIGALSWGFVIGAFGFPAPFFVALLTMVGIAALVWAARADLLRRPPSATSPT
jgi:MFS family permease